MAFHRTYYSREQLEDRSIQMAIAWWPIEDVIALKQLHIAEDYEYKRFIARMLGWEREQAALRALEQRYSPDQPRVPAGEPTGGQWVGNNHHETGRRVPRTMTPHVTGDKPKHPSPAGVAVAENRPASIVSDAPRIGVEGDGVPTADRGAVPPPDYNGVVIRDPVTERQPTLPSDAQPLLAPNGQQVFNPHSGSDSETPQFVYFPKDYPPDLFMEIGEAARVAEDENSLWSSYQKVRALIDFRQGGILDVQRSSGTLQSAYIDYSTVAIGLWAASAGVSLDSILRIEDSYALFRSNFPEETVYDQIFGSLPIRNVENTQIGYNLYNLLRKRGMQ